MSSSGGGIGLTLTGGVQNIAVILPLLGTEQCQTRLKWKQAHTIVPYVRIEHDISTKTFDSECPHPESRSSIRRTTKRIAPVPS